MSEVKSYKDLLIWQKGIDLVKDIYNLTKKFPKSEQYGLIDQIHRSAISVPSNIAEGQARQHSKEFIQFLYISLGSLAELDTQFIISKELAYINEDDLTKIDSKITEIRKMISGLLSKLTSGH
ncbi:MAG: four helix bundle protein [Planctomycetota bacterium]